MFLLTKIVGMGITKGDVARYVFLPQVLPRLHNFISAGFGSLAYFIALVFRAVNILPSHHPYLQAGSNGQYSIRNVLSEAAHHVNFGYRHIDQVIVFFAIIAGLFLLALQFVILLATVAIQPASAQSDMPQNYGGFFEFGGRDEDLALRLLDKVFGIPNFFGTKDAVRTGFHDALGGLFQFYSIGMLVVAAIILIYFIFVVVAETAQTGTPFGKRFNHAWAPIRLVVAIGLLIPISYGFNAAQWITLYSAKFGSGFATAGWIKFNETLNDNYINSDELVAKPKIPDLKNMAAFAMISHGCIEAYSRRNAGAQNSGSPNITPYIIKAKDGGGPMSLAGTSYEDAVKFANGKDIHIRVGAKGDGYTDYIAKIFPYCGDIILQNTEPAKVNEFGNMKFSTTQIMNREYYRLLQRMLTTDYEGIKTAAENHVAKKLSNAQFPDLDPKLRDRVKETAKKDVEKVLDRLVEKAKSEIEKDENYKKLGWGGAGIWYNQIADVNGRVTTAALNKPQIKLFPHPMEIVCKENQQQNKKQDATECYRPSLSKGKKVVVRSEVDKSIATALSGLFDFWYKDKENVTGNAFIDVINLILGTQGIFDMCENADQHPLAQLSSAGKGLIEAAVRNIGFSLGFGTAGIFTGYFGPTLSAVSGFFSAAASTGILIGFVLFYLVPFMPFLYFLFAVGGWVKGIFEAMVGVPLWALAHLRIDGQGLPGDGAINGYFLIFEIFLRPILIVFGLLASILIFGASVKVLNEIFSLVVSNLSGFDTEGASSCGAGNPNGTANTGGGGSNAPTGSIEYFRGPVDEFFFTIVYAIIVYMIGMSSFKLIDQIPNQILRWMGQGVSTFNDDRGEPAEGLISKMAIGGGMAGQQIQGAVAAGKQGLGSLAAGAKDMVTPKQSG
ncbi:MAG: DotA/TraY family protein [Alphaproteobacteria bacterium]|nr:DotA/TraY family protein [Alphaproteobacteria bacterium]